MGDDFRRDVLRFAEAVQTHIPNEHLLDWLSANMPRAIPALNLGPATKSERVCKRETAEARPPAGTEAATEARPPAGTEAAEARPPSPVGMEAAEARPPAGMEARQEEVLLDERVARSGLSPKLFVWQVPELRTFIEGLEEFLQSMGNTDISFDELALSVTVLAVLLRGVRGLRGIAETSSR